MGYTITGKDPDEKGEDFWANSAVWIPLAEYVRFAAPEIHIKCADWLAGCGEGLGAGDAWDLSEILAAKIASHETAAYAVTLQASLDSLEDLVCGSCDGTGEDPNSPFILGGALVENEPAEGEDAAAEFGRYMDQWFAGLVMAPEDSDEPRRCFPCRGTGKLRPDICRYRLDEAIVECFVGFLRQCGGFEICY